ncbi:unnamed protein product, partial [Mycena citricolor]
MKGANALKQAEYSNARPQVRKNNAWWEKVRLHGPQIVHLSGVSRRLETENILDSLPLMSRPQRVSALGRLFIGHTF